MNKYVKQLYEGIITNNPVLVQLIGMCPTLATSTSLENGLGMGLAATAVLICSNVMVSILRKIIPQKIRIASYVVIISGFVTAIEMLMKAYLPDLAGCPRKLICIAFLQMKTASSMAEPCWKARTPSMPPASSGCSRGRISPFFARVKPMPR